MYVSPACSPCPQCFMVILRESPIESESPVVLQEDCTSKMSARYYSELWCGGKVAQTQSIQQTGFLGIRQGLKKNLCCCLNALSSPCLVTAEPHINTHVEKPVALCVTPQGSDSYNSLFSLLSIPSKCFLLFDELRGEERECLLFSSSPLS